MTTSAPQAAPQRVNLPLPGIDPPQPVERQRAKPALVASDPLDNLSAAMRAELLRVVDQAGEGCHATIPDPFVRLVFSQRGLIQKVSFMRPAEEVILQDAAFQLADRIREAQR